MDLPEWPGIVLAGAPGAGKRTTAFALETLGRRYVRFPALTTAHDSPLDATPARAAHIADLRAWAQVFHEVTRDGAVHVHDRVRLDEIRGAGGLPVVTVDEPAGLDAFPEWLAVLLRCCAAQRTRRGYAACRPGESGYGPTGPWRARATASPSRSARICSLWARWPR